VVDFDALAAPFDPAKVSWRIGQMQKNVPQGQPAKGKALAYLDARDVMNRLDEVCGPGGWQNRYSHAENKTVCEIGIRIGPPLQGIDDWVWKADGAGDSDIEAQKGALSDAFKRAAVRWGIGRYLYDIPSPWVEVNQWKQIEDKEHARLEGLLQQATTEFEWGSPESRATLRVLLGTIQSVVKTADDVRLWREANKGVFAQMRVKARERVEEELQRIVDAAAAHSA